MALFVLDTDHLSLFQRGYGLLLPRIRAVPASRIAITIVSVEEMLQGRLAQVRRASQGQNRINAYTWLEKTLMFFKPLGSSRLMPRLSGYTQTWSLGDSVSVRRTLKSQLLH